MQAFQRQHLTNTSIHYALTLCYYKVIWKELKKDTKVISQIKKHKEVVISNCHKCIFFKGILQKDIQLAINDIYRHLLIWWITNSVHVYKQEKNVFFLNFKGKNFLSWKVNCLQKKKNKRIHSSTSVSVYETNILFYSCLEEFKSAKVYN